MKNLTKREKVLMYILVYVLIIVGGIFLLCMPALEKYTSLKDEYTAIETQWLTTKAGIVEYKDLDKQIQDATNTYNELLNKFYIADSMHSEDIDQLITTLARNHYLKPTSLQISAVSEEEVMNYKDYLQEAAKKNTEETKNEEATKVTTTTAKVFDVSLTVTGRITNLQAMINEANSIKTLKVSEVTYSSQKEATEAMSVTFKIYMI